jgi:hypothetical protein
LLLSVEFVLDSPPPFFSFLFEMKEITDEINKLQEKKVSEKRSIERIDSTLFYLNKKDEEGLKSSQK